MFDDDAKLLGFFSVKRWFDKLVLVNRFYKHPVLPGHIEPPGQPRCLSHYELWCFCVSVHHTFPKMERAFQTACLYPKGMMLPMSWAAVFGHRKFCLSSSSFSLSTFSSLLFLTLFLLLLLLPLLLCHCFYLHVYLVQW